MRGKVAKRIRRSVYGDDSPRARTYLRDKSTGTIIAGTKRGLYQKAKKAWTTKDDSRLRKFVSEM